jgi:SAM-dependent methyltransferase
MSTGLASVKDAPAAERAVACRICGGTALRDVTAREMMFGTRDEFAYRECESCGCVQIAAYPPNIAEYYPADYYSFQGAVGARRPRPLESWLRRRRAMAALGRPNLFGLLMNRRVPPPECYRWLARVGMNLGNSILDVGCGNGLLLATLHRDGAERLAGVDPFARDDARQQPGFRIYERLEQVPFQPDFMLLSHSLEHMPDQHQVFADLRRAAGPHSWLCVRIPLANAAWRRYGSDWVQLDPPRHYYLHTARSLRHLALAAGFHVEHVDFDSTGLQLWGSEQIRRGIPFADPSGHARAIGGRGLLFSQGELERWEHEAAELNRAEEGDQATFYLRRSP